MDSADVRACAHKLEGDGCSLAHFDAGTCRTSTCPMPCRADAGFGTCEYSCIRCETSQAAREDEPAIASESTAIAAYDEPAFACAIREGGEFSPFALVVGASLVASFGLRRRARWR